ncbi:MAG: hypothetical protein A3I05_06225 [Deltaproteobacteria bacterium RIFCSPLOWO2_02_FULL_44_10]|nr:MAG: hypothetical protein A3C46_09615 [Deltaproteobacteria bacterium RIFCSPHIGHO2_02_FULL_44_16]OGQ45143.1 MAG: hypothetical protein A3I05_06225 [Deltaproteobacteria bacterium RIFCSPLOWO2_02_FULL_44_10]
MGSRIFVVLASLLFIASCSAFDSKSKTVSAPPPADPDVAAASAYQGFYSGEMTNETNTCQADVVVEGPLSIDVIQAGDVVSIQFEDATEGRGTLAGNNATILMEEGEVSSVYNLSFNEEGAEGSLEIIETKVDGQLGDPCAKSSLKLTKGEKPEGWGVVVVPAEEDSETPAK